jgi:anaerobic ribonucleoside-triphosphate reductase activating protein
MNYLGIDKTSISNGPGVRVVLWVSGCKVHCKGCQNPESWDFCAGKLFDDNAKQDLFDALSKPYIRGITISGGNPLDQAQDIFILISEIKSKFPNKDIWLYSGYTYEEIRQSRQRFKGIMGVDVLVDGPYIEEQRDITLKFRGSKNQRLIDVNETLKQGKIITIQN